MQNGASAQVWTATPSQGAATSRTAGKSWFSISPGWSVKVAKLPVSTAAGQAANVSSSAAWGVQLPPSTGGKAVTVSCGSTWGHLLLPCVLHLPQLHLQLLLLLLLLAACLLLLGDINHVRHDADEVWKVWVAFGQQN